MDKIQKQPQSVFPDEDLNFIKINQATALYRLIWSWCKCHYSKSTLYISAGTHRSVLQVWILLNTNFTLVSKGIGLREEEFGTYKSHVTVALSHAPFLLVTIVSHSKVFCTSHVVLPILTKSHKITD